MDLMSGRTLTSCQYYGAQMKILYLTVLILWASAVHAVEMTIVFLTAEQPEVAVLSNLDPIPEDIGQAGFDLGVTDNQTTGKFLGQRYNAHHITIPLDDDPAPYFFEALGVSPFIVADVPVTVLRDLAAHPKAQDSLIFNASAQEAELRDDACAPNVFHTIPSYAMRADALSQTFVSKRWSDVAMIYGSYPQDQKLAEAMRVSFAKFGLRLRSEKQWAADADIRRTASSEIPIFTQDLKDHDVLVVVDEVDDFGRYVAYNTWLPRPIAGTQGLRPIAWDRTAEQWGAAQLQSRFTKASDRAMFSRDYAAWAAVRTLGEAVTRTNSADPKVIRDYILSPEFELAGFKGRALSYRSWNGQLRQPIPVVGPTAVVANAPLDGFLHQNNELDTLGLDQAESNCKTFAR